MKWPLYLIRERHTLCGGLACGGQSLDDNTTQSTCSQLRGRDFVTTSVQLLQNRIDHLCWAIDGGIFLIGGSGEQAKTTVEWLTGFGGNTEAKTSLSHEVRQSCGIDLGKPSKFFLKSVEFSTLGLDPPTPP